MSEPAICARNCQRVDRALTHLPTRHELEPFAEQCLQHLWLQTVRRPGRADEDESGQDHHKGEGEERGTYQWFADLRYFGQNFELIMELKSDKLDERQVTASEVLTAIQRQHIELPAGRLETSGREVNVRVLGEA